MDAAVARVRDLDETELIAALRAGDETAYAWLVHTYHAPLLRLARAHVRSPAIAEEVVQDTWLGVLRSIHRFEGRCSLKTWLFQILLNRARSRGVRERRTTPLSALGGDAETGVAMTVLEPSSPRSRRRWTSHPSVPEGAPEQVTETREALEVIAGAIDELPARYRQVIVLRDIEQRSSDETASLLELTTGNQRVLLHRARTKVRERVEPYFAGACA